MKIEGKIYHFILDTGAPNVISKEIYDLIKPKLAIYSQVMSASNIKIRGEKTCPNPLLNSVFIDSFCRNNILHFWNIG